MSAAVEKVFKDERMEKMKLKCNKYSMEIVPEGTLDEVYLEHITGCLKKDDTCVASRVAVLGCDRWWAYLEIRKAGK